MTFGLLEVFQIVFNALMLIAIAALVYGMIRNIASGSTRTTQKLWHKNRFRKNPAKNTKKKLK